MKKAIKYDGLTFVRDDKTGYYLNSKTHKRLHRYVWEKHHGEIPKGYDIHHVDKDKSNNEISNLQLISRKDHMKLHGEMLTEEERQSLRENLEVNARPKASEWHGSQEGIEWHKKHYANVKEQLHKKKELKCKHCNKAYLGTREGFCSNACKSAYRRKMGRDNESRKCAYCGKEFIVSKYSKTIHCSRHCTAKGKANK